MSRHKTDLRQITETEGDDQASPVLDVTRRKYLEALIKMLSAVKDIGCEPHEREEAYALLEGVICLVIDGLNETVGGIVEEAEANSTLPLGGRLH